MANKENIVKLAQQLIRAKTTNPPGNEKAVADIIAQRLKAAGLKIEILEAATDRPNVLATWDGGKGKTLILEGHMDTVPAREGWKHQPFEALIDGGRLYGRGAADMKGSLASMVSAIEELKKEGWKPKGKLMFLACPNEEMGDPEKIGMGYVADKLKADLMVMGDTSDFDIVIAEKGVLWLEFTAIGKEAHGSMPWLGINAIEKLGKFLIELNNLELDREHRLLGKPTISINTIVGGFKTNVVPGSCKATVDIRILPGMKKEDVLKKVDELIARLHAKDKDMKIEYRAVTYFEPTETDAGAPYIAELKRIAEGVLKRGIKIKGEHGSTGAIIFRKVGLPTLVWGPGKPELAHIMDEYIEVKDLENATEIYKAFIKGFLG